VLEIGYSQNIAVEREQKEEPLLTKSYELYLGSDSSAAQKCFAVLLSEAKNPSLIAAIEERFFASLRMTTKTDGLRRITNQPAR
jgi:hypothetical protein